MIIKRELGEVFIDNNCFSRPIFIKVIERLTINNCSVCCYQGICDMCSSLRLSIAGKYPNQERRDGNSVIFQFENS